MTASTDHQKTSVFTAACVVISTMIGAGVFGTTGFMARDLGSPALILVLWLAGCGYALLGVLCYRELATLVPRSGGEYAYIQAAFGPLLGFLSGWVSFTVGFGAAAAAIAHLFASYSSEWLAGVSPKLSFLEGLGARRGLALFLVWVLTWVHLAGVQYGGATQRWLTYLKVGAILAVIAAAFSLGAGDWGHVESTAKAAPSLATIFVSFLFVSFCYSGWNAAVYITQEVHGGSGGVKPALLSGTLVVGVLYLALNVVYLYALPVSELASEPIEPVARKAVTALLGSTAGHWTAALLALSLAGTCSAMIWTGPRVYEEMAKDGGLPRFLGRRNRASDTPVAAIFLQSVWITALVVLGVFEQLILYSAALMIIFAAAAVLGLYRLRPREDRRGALAHVAPAGFLVISLISVVALVVRDPLMAIYTMATVALGVALFWLLSVRGLAKRTG